MSEFKKADFGMKIEKMDIDECRGILDRGGWKRVEDWLVFYGCNGGIAWRYAVVNNNVSSADYGRILYIDMDDDGEEEITEEKKSYTEVLPELRELRLREINQL